MGIQGLLPFLKNASREADIKNFSGATVAVDAYCWLHKGAFSCAEKLGKGEPTDGYVHFCMKMVNMMLAAGVKPILVFDGQNLPSKSVTEAKRRENREKYCKMAKQFLREGKVKEARECFQKTVDITPEMAHQVIVACRKKNVDCIVAPYEADAQLAYLAKSGLAQIVITEDSDLVLFGCEKVIFKMDMGGRGVMVERSAIAKCLGARAENFTFEKFRYMCILSGCDYLPSLPGIGLAKSCKFFNLITNPDVYKSLSKLPNYLKMPNLVVTVEYKDGFVRANNTFLYQLVFCPISKKLVPLHPYPPDVDPKDMPYAGSYLSEDVALQLAMGNIHLHTLKSFDDESPPQKPYSATREMKENCSSIWDGNYKIPKQCTPEKRKVQMYQTRGETVIVNSQKIFKQIVGPYKREREHLSADAFTEEQIEADLTNSFTLPASKKANSKKSPLENSFCNNIPLLDSTLTKSSPQIVRSRFFVNSPSVSRETPPRISSWLDAIDNEYQMGSPSPTSSMGTSRKSPFTILDRKITCANQHPTTQLKSRSYTDENSKDETSLPIGTTISQCCEDSPSIVQPKRREATKFRWSKSLLDSSFGAKLQNSPKSELDFKCVFPKSTSSDSNKDKEKCLTPTSSQSVLSQYTMCSVDEESFTLSQRSSRLLPSCPNVFTFSQESALKVYQELDDIFQDAVGDVQKVVPPQGKNKCMPLKEKVMPTSKNLGSRCSGLRKRVAQVSIKDMMNRFCFERTSRTISK